ncbi:Hypothetical predicted protein [Octopus vulgaris]|uniref:Uncharacterized protein n=1 Tax=Octopus vulgaris TaxID=6645 RepID=A0AA36FG70_OCTVU|nr:Hypothetical predicted protein [Octopus vulgaris]
MGVCGMVNGGGGAGVSGGNRNCGDGAAGDSGDSGCVVVVVAVVFGGVTIGRAGVGGDTGARGGKSFTIEFGSEKRDINNSCGIGEKILL